MVVEPGDQLLFFESEGVILQLLRRDEFFPGELFIPVEGIAGRLLVSGTCICVWASYKVLTQYPVVPVVLRPC
jgi:hypothetical protein